MAAVRSQIASALDILVHLGRMKDGSRKVLNISQIEGIRDGTIRISTLFEYKRIDEDPGAQPRLVRTGVPLKIMKGNMEEQYETFF